MKISLIIALLSSVLAFSANAQSEDENPDQASSDVINKHFDFAEYKIVLKVKDLSEFPQTLDCGKDHYGNKFLINLADQVGTEDYGPGMYLSRFDADSLMINKSDGDQVSMIKMKVSELKALAKGQITELLALTAEGFWWADGDHIQGGTTVCKLAQATNRKPRRQSQP